MNHYLQHFNRVRGAELRWNACSKKLWLLLQASSSCKPAYVPPPEKAIVPYVEDEQVCRISWGKSWEAGLTTDRGSLVSRLHQASGRHQLESLVASPVNRFWYSGIAKRLSDMLSSSSCDQVFWEPSLVGLMTLVSLSLAARWHVAYLEFFCTWLCT